jgi:large subunit ribosomal protein L31
MKQDTHPDYHFITVVMTDGTSYPDPFDLREGRRDPEPGHRSEDVHPAWTGGNHHLLDRGGRVSRFNAKFGAFTKK